MDVETLKCINNNQTQNERINKMKTYKESLISMSNGLMELPLDNDEKWILKNRFIDRMEVGDEADFINQLYSFCSLGSLHERENSDFLHYHRLLNYFSIVFYNSEKVRTTIMKFYKTQGYLGSWYDEIRPMLSYWNIPGWDTFK